MDPTFESQLRSDGAALREIFGALDRLEAEWEQARPAIDAGRRGYFTPDEDDRARQMLLTYRNLRLSLYDLIGRYEGYAELPDERDRLRGFLVAYAAGLTLYAKSLRLVETYEDDPLVRRKLNEPDAKFGIGEGFFEEVLAAFTSFGTYRRLGRAHRFWRGRRRAVRDLRLADDPACGWLADVVRRQRASARRTFWRVVRHRLRYDWGALWRSAFSPVRMAKRGTQTFLGAVFAGGGAPPKRPPAVDAALLERIRCVLRPGDVLLVRSEGKITTALIPGFWPHAALYVGGPRDLEALGAAVHPYVRKHWETLAGGGEGGGSVVEAFSPAVTLSPLERCLQVDHVLVLRPNVDDAGRRDAVAEAFGHLGKPYDFDFDFTVTTRLVCTEVVYRCYHRRGPIDFPLVKRMGRFTLTGDDIVKLCLDGASDPAAAPFAVAYLVLRLADGKARVIPEEEAVAWVRAIQGGLRPSEVCALPAATCG